MRTRGYILCNNRKVNFNINFYLHREIKLMFKIKRVQRRIKLCYLWEMGLVISMLYEIKRLRYSIFHVYSHMQN